MWLSRRSDGKLFEIFPLKIHGFFTSLMQTVKYRWRVIVTHAIRLSRLQMPSQKLKIFLMFYLGFLGKFRQILIYVFISIYYPQTTLLFKTLKINKGTFRLIAPPYDVHTK